jgi:hypothetical protein
VKVKITERIANVQKSISGKNKMWNLDKLKEKRR